MQTEAICGAGLGHVMASANVPVFPVLFFSTCGFSIRGAALSGLFWLRWTRLRARSRSGPKNFLEAAPLLGAIPFFSSAVDIEATGDRAGDTGTASDVVAAGSDPIAMLAKAPLPGNTMAAAVDSETGMSEFLVPPVLLHRLPQSRRSLSVRALSCPSSTVMSPSASSTHIPFSRSSDVGLERSNASNMAFASSGDSASRTCWIAI